MSYSGEPLMNQSLSIEVAAAAERVRLPAAYSVFILFNNTTEKVWLRAGRGSLTLAGIVSRSRTQIKGCGVARHFCPPLHRPQSDPERTWNRAGSERRCRSRIAAMNKKVVRDAVTT